MASSDTIPAADFLPGCPLEEVIANDLLQSRPAPSIDPAVERDVISVLSNGILTGSERMLELLADHALRLCRAQSAGISLEDLAVSPPVFRWRATAGRLEAFVNGTMPHHFSPCTETVTRNQVLLMREPVRHYPYVRALGIPMTEVLLAPFTVEAKPVGTVWVVMHDESRRFDQEDARMLVLLSRFAAMAVGMIQRSHIDAGLRH